MPEHDILVISHEAQAYADLLRDGLPQGVQVTAVRRPDEFSDALAGHGIALGEPHLLAAVAGLLPQLHWVQSTWAGIKPLLPLAASGVQVTGVKDVFGPKMAEYVLGYLLARELKIFARAGQQLSGNGWTQDNERLAGRTVGIMGTGSIGAHIAHKLQPFDVRLLGYSRSGAAVMPFEQVYGAAQLHDFLASLDYLVCVLPDTPDTDGLLDATALAQLPAGAVLVNVGRGPVLDEQALAVALHEGALAGAVLDVFREEPLPPEHPFWSAPNLLLTAHIAARSYPRDITAIFIDNYQRLLRGEALLHRVDPQRGY
jgi:phosphoglycerate dehydrogenase-like enzyme